MSDEFKIDQHSPTWAAIETKLKANIEEARGFLEDGATPEGDGYWRGYIKAMRTTLLMAETKPPPKIAPGLSQSEIH